MGDIYHKGDIYAGSVPIDDTQTTAINTWSAQKIDNEIDTKTSKSIITSNDVFDSTKAYVAGDWLIHNNILYEVKVACTGVTPPNATYYAVRTIEDVISILKGSNLTPYKGGNVISGDFNNYTQSGIYGCNNTSGIANAPVSSADNGYLIVFALTNLYIVQIWVGTYQGDLAIRYYHTTTWSAWDVTTFKPLQGSTVTYNVDISNNDATNRYAVPCDGYIVCAASTGLARAGSFNGYLSITANQYVTTNSTFVKKGTLIQCTVSGDGKVYFRA